MYSPKEIYKTNHHYRHSGIGRNPWNEGPKWIPGQTQNDGERRNISNHLGVLAPWWFIKNKKGQSQMQNREPVVNESEKQIKTQGRDGDLGGSPPEHPRRGADTNESEYQIKTKAWVIFTGETNLKYLKVLKRGFRHCFVILNDGKHWIAMDPLASQIELTVPEVPVDFDLPIFMQSQGCLSVPASITQQSTQAPIGIISCVETVKRVLGIHKLNILTPWQLYKYLINQSQNLTQKHPKAQARLRRESAGASPARG